MRRLQSRILVLVLGLAAPALAYEDSPALDPGSDAPAATGETKVGPIQPFVPPGVDYPGIVDLGPRLSLYFDHTYEYTDDLSTFWWVDGRGRNYRVALGGTYRFGNLQLHAEVPLQYTQLTIFFLMQQPPVDADRNKAGFSLGDVITDLAYFWDLPFDTMPTHVGLGLHVRWPTHTTKFRFGLIDGSTLEFGFPYYLHLAPAALLSTSYGPVFLVVNQGALAMLAKDVNLGGAIQRIPNIYFWESHVAAGLAATDWLAFTLELSSFVQLNRVNVENMATLNDTRAVFLNPGVTLDLGNYRVAVAMRWDLGHWRSARDFGVITFSGSSAILARLSYLF
jgi:hypothetical protein